MEQPIHSDAPTEFRFIALSCAALLQQQYKEALRLLRQGLDDSIESGKQYDGQELLRWFSSLVTTLELVLEEAYGDEWQDKLSIPEIPEKEIVCSFCRKAQEEVAKIIAGPEVYICNECVSICNEIIVEKK